MEIKIAGAGKIAGGEYEDVHVSGSASASGAIRTNSLEVAGSMKTDSVMECKGAASVSGALKAEGDFAAETLTVSGALSVGGSANLGKQAKITGKLTVENEIKGKDIFVSGQLECGEGIEAEKFVSRGSAVIGGLLNADDIEIVYGTVGEGLGRGNSSISEIGGSHVVIRRGSIDKKIKKLPLLGKLFGQNPSVTVTEGIEGDEITLEGVETPRVVGRVVRIGEECKIDTVEYAESIEVAPSSQVLHKIHTEDAPVSNK